MQLEHVRKSIYGGIAYCACCGGAMCSSGTVHKGEREKYWFLSCLNIPKRSKIPCTDGARIKYEVLNQVVSHSDQGTVTKKVNGSMGFKTQNKNEYSSDY